MIVDTTNTNLGTLAAGQTWTGAWYDIQFRFDTRLGQAAQVITSFKSDQAGEFTLEFSSDGVTVDRSIGPYSLAANTDSPQPVAPVRAYYRAKFTNTSGSTANLRIQTLVSPTPGLFKTRLQDTPSPLSPADLTRAVLFGRTEGGGVFRNASISSEGHLELQISSPRTAFGEISVAELAPVVQIADLALTGYNARLHRRQLKGSASFDVGSGTGRTKMVASTGTTANSLVYGGSLRRSIYRAGQGLCVRFTAMFTTPVASTTQWAGLGDVCNGFAVGYNGTTFGLRHWRHGKREVRTLALSAAAGGAETATVTLDGVAKAVSLVSGTAVSTSNQLAAADYSATGGGWDAYSYTTGGTSYVVFVSRVAGPLAGTYTLASTGTAAGTITRTTAGVSVTETWVAQTSWNCDVLDGDSTMNVPVSDNPSGVDLDPTKLNVYQFQLQYLGAGDVYFSVEVPETGQIQQAHIFRVAGTLTDTTLGETSLPFTMCADNGATTSSVSVSSASCFVGVEGNRAFTGPSMSVRNSKSGVTTETAVVSIHNPLVWNGEANTAPLVFQEVVFTNQGGNGLVAWRAVRGATLGTGATATAAFAAASTVMPTQTDVAFGTGASGGDEILATYQPPNTTSQRAFDLIATDAGRVYPGETLTFLASTSGSAITAAVAVALRWDV